MLLGTVEVINLDIIFETTPQGASDLKLSPLRVSLLKTPLRSVSVLKPTPLQDGFIF